MKLLKNLLIKSLLILMPHRNWKRSEMERHGVCDWVCLSGSGTVSGFVFVCPRRLRKHLTSLSIDELKPGIVVHPDVTENLKDKKYQNENLSHLN